jgi:hypothetical protein
VLGRGGAHHRPLSMVMDLRGGVAMVELWTKSQGGAAGGSATNVALGVCSRRQHRGGSELYAAGR